MPSVRDAVLSHVEAAEQAGRIIPADEAALIDLVASAPDPEPIVVHAADPLPAAPAGRDVLGAWRLPESDAEQLVTAARDRRSATVRAAAVTYATHSTSGGIVAPNRRLVDVLLADGAARSQESSRKFDYVGIASGDAALWTSGAKSEVVLALKSEDAFVAAAIGLITEVSRLDVPALDQIVGGLLARRVIALENGTAADKIADAATVATGTATAEGTIMAAVSACWAAGVEPTRLLLAPDIAAAVLETKNVGFYGDPSMFGGTLFGIPYSVAALTAGTAVALDSASLAVQTSPLLIAVGSTNFGANEVGVRVETSTAVALLDAHAAHAAVKTA